MAGFVDSGDLILAPEQQPRFSILSGYLEAASVLLAAGARVDMRNYRKKLGAHGRSSGQWTVDSRPRRLYDLCS